MVLTASSATRIEYVALACSPPLYDMTLLLLFFYDRALCSVSSLRTARAVLLFIYENIYMVSPQVACTTNTAVLNVGHTHLSSHDCCVSPYYKYVV